VLAIKMGAARLSYGDNSSNINLVISSVRRRRKAYLKPGKQQRPLFAVDCSDGIILTVYHRESFSPEDIVGGIHRSIAIQVAVRTRDHDDGKCAGFALYGTGRLMRLPVIARPELVRMTAVFLEPLLCASVRHEWEDLVGLECSRRLATLGFHGVTIGFAVRVVSVR
jgi:hypothetical protein